MPMPWSGELRTTLADVMSATAKRSRMSQTRTRTSSAFALRLCRYVTNQSFDRAQALLEKTHFCIVAGIPGIGKTTLAEVLLADLVDRQGFAAYRVAHDLSELRPVENQKSKQVFHFDDFLGTTALDKLQKNEDRRLVELMEEVAANPNWRFILTTREYILNIAKRQHEAFAHPPVDFRRSPSRHSSRRTACWWCRCRPPTHRARRTRRLTMWRGAASAGARRSTGCATSSAGSMGAARSRAPARAVLMDVPYFDR